MGRMKTPPTTIFSAFFYPALQAADIFELEVDIAFGGMDQRKSSHVHERGCRQEWLDKAHLHPYANAFRIEGSGRQNGFLRYKMSKSDPNNAVILHDSKELLQKKMKKAFLEVGNDSSAYLRDYRTRDYPYFGRNSNHPRSKVWLSIQFL